jgi:hypothetical protein
MLFGVMAVASKYLGTTGQGQAQVLLPDCLAERPCRCVSEWEWKMSGEATSYAIPSLRYRYHLPFIFSLYLCLPNS